MIKGPNSYVIANQQGFLLSRDGDWWSWVSATCAQRINESILIPRGANASHDVLKGCKSYIWLA